MKKVLSTIAVSTALIMGGAVAASAAGIELDGSLQSRGYSKVVKNAYQDQAPETAYDQKATLGVKSKVSDQLTGYFKLETGTGSGDTYKWGATASDLHNGGSKPADSKMELVEAWINYKPSNWGIKVGHMPLALGNNTYFDHRASGDDAVVVYADVAGSHIGALTIKLIENTTTDNSDDLDAYVLLMTRKFNDSFKGGLNYTLIKGSAEQNETGGPVLTPGMALSNLGMDATFTIGALTLQGDANFQFGTLSDDGTTKVDAEGWMAQVKADYKMGKSTIGAMFGYGSGDDSGTANDNEVYLSWLTDSPYYNIWIPGYNIQVPGSAGKNGGLSNLTVYQLNGSTSTTCPITGKALALTAAVNFMNTSEDVLANGVLQDEIGTEINLVAKWKLNSNLTYFVQSAYLFAGDAWNSAGNNNDPDNMYFLRHGISMKF